MDFTGTVAGAFLACNVGMLGRTQLRVQLDESGSATCSLPALSFTGNQAGGRLDITISMVLAAFNSHGLGGQLLVVGLHTRPRCRSPEFLVIETPALEGAAAEYRGMRVFAHPPYSYVGLL